MQDIRTSRFNWMYLFCLVGQSSDKCLSPLRLWVRIWVRTRYTHVRWVSQRFAKSRGFSPGTLVSSHLKCWQGWLRIKIDIQPTLPSYSSCAPFAYGRKPCGKRAVTVLEIDCKPISTTVTTRLRPYGNQAAARGAFNMPSTQWTQYKLER